MLYLSYTACKRFERCGELQRQWSAKLVKAEVDQKPFFVGRVVHDAFEAWLLAGPERAPLVDYLAPTWAREEAKLAGIDWALRWVGDERNESWARAAKLLVQLEADAKGLTRFAFSTELSYRCEITDTIGMYAKVDFWGEHPTEPVDYLVELKSGTSYDPAQVDWYAAVATIARRAQQQPERHIIGVSLRPAMAESVGTGEITKAAMLEQVNRAHAIATEMQAGRWPARPQGFCSKCEGRTLCPDYQMRFGRATTGRVGFS